jgi:hypothetical protein
MLGWWTDRLLVGGAAVLVLAYYGYLSDALLLSFLYVVGSQVYTSLRTSLPPLRVRSFVSGTQSLFSLCI